MATLKETSKPTTKEDKLFEKDPVLAESDFYKTIYSIIHDLQKRQIYYKTLLEQPEEKN